MQSQDESVKSKFSLRPDGRWQASRATVPVTSRLVADCMAAAYQRAIETHAAGRLGDLGCGKVPLYGMYREKVDDVVCIDWPSSLHGSLHVDRQADLNLPLDCEPESFDTLVATDVIEHLHAPATFFASAFRLLRPGGHLIVGVPFLYWIHEAPHDYYRYTRYALERLAADAGLKVRHLEPYGGPAEVLADLLTKSVGKVRIAAHSMYWTTRIVLAVPPIRKLSRSRSEIMPMGYVLVARKAAGT